MACFRQMKKKRVTILGSTGSIGSSALDVARALGDRFDIVGLAALDEVDLMAGQIDEFSPGVVALADEASAARLSEIRGKETRVLAGADGVRAVAAENVDIVLSAVVGGAGLLPTIEAINAGNNIALANKEALVMAGPIVTSLAREKGVVIIPVDSEHSAIFQCLGPAPPRSVEKLILTASGGPFFRMGLEELSRVTPEEALAHPVWSMGPKISIDSATLMNKGLEVIEATWFFDISPDDIDVVIHPQSVVHSMVQFVDGSVLAQLSIPDMKIPIQYALTYPERVGGGCSRIDFPELGELTFEEPPRDRFPALDLAFGAARAKGTLPAVMNAANEVAVNAFLRGMVKFTGIVEVVSKTMAGHDVVAEPNLEQILEADAWARRKAGELVDRGW